MKQHQIVRYWGRKPLELAREYINRYSKPGDIVLDNFGGSGIFAKTALELRRKAIYIDLNPFAELIAHSTIEGCDAEVFMAKIRKVINRKNVPVKIDREYSTVSLEKIFSVKCACGRDVEAKCIEFSRRYSVNCKRRRDLDIIFHNIPSSKKELVKKIQDNGSIFHNELVKFYKNVSSVRFSTLIKSLVRQGIIQEEEIPISAIFRQTCDCGRKEVTFENNRIWSLEDPIEPVYWFPKKRLLYKSGKPFLKKRDAENVSEFFLNRSLVLLSALWRDISTLKTSTNVKRCLRLIFMASLARSSKMCRKSGGTWPVNSYWIPRNYIVKNPYVVFEEAAIRFYRFLKDKPKIKCGDIDDILNGKADVAFIIEDATRMNLPRSSVDYVIIDPPHTDEAQFFELSLFYTSWLRRKLRFKDELVINSHQGKSLETYLKLLNKAAERIYYALKDKGFFTVILHEESLEILEQCVKAIKKTGFELIKKNEMNDYWIYTFKKQ